MKKILQKSGPAVLTALGLVLLGVAPSAAQTTANFNLNSAGSGLNYAGVYTSPYSASINGGATVPVICDDFGDNSYIPEDWTAYVTTLSQIQTANPAPLTYLQWKGASSYSLDQADAYTVAAILAVEIIQSNPNGASGSTAQQLNQEELSFALWELFDPTASVGNANLNRSTPLLTDAVETWSGISSTFLQDAKNDVTTAIAQLSNPSAVLNGYNVTVYSYDSCISGPCTATSPANPPQEFIAVSMPEPSSVATLATYFLMGGVGLFFMRRRQTSKSDSKA
jgi:hypothetical protein